MHKGSLNFLRSKSYPRCINVIQVGKDWHVHLQFHFTLSTFMHSHYPLEHYHMLQHWICGWGMVNIMCNVILATTNHVVQNMSCDEVTTIDNHSWILMHYYVVEIW
jgi:hypothetical protein